MNKNEHKQSRRDFLKKVGYTAPAILTMAAVPSIAKSGSKPHVCLKGNNGIGQYITRGIEDPPPPGLQSKSGKDFNDGGMFVPPSENGGKYGYGPFSSSK